MGPPPGAYRTAAAYLRRQPTPGGAEAFFPDKRGNLVVVVPQGAGSVKVRLAPDSIWGYVSQKQRTFRIYRGQEYRLVHADTLSIYTVNAEQTSAAMSGGPRYYFSRGLKGLIFPLTVPYLRKVYAAGNPAFAAALGEMPLHHSLVDLDRKTGLYRVTTLYRQAAPR